PFTGRVFKTCSCLGRTSSETFSVTSSGAVPLAPVLSATSFVCARTEAGAEITVMARRTPSNRISMPSWDRTESKGLAWLDEDWKPYGEVERKPADRGLTMA